jgi:hypothetical protein
MHKDSTKNRGTSRTASKGEVAKKSAAEFSAYEKQILAADKERTEKLYGAVQESVEIMGERLRAGDSTRDIANSFLLCVSNRFDQIAKPDFHEGLGYDHNSAQITSNLRRIEQNLSRKTLVPDHGRIDTVLSDLVDEVIRLAQSQSVYCEHCEHCLRERYTHGFDAIITATQSFTTDDSVDDETWAYIVERFGDLAGADGSNAVVVALRHIASMAWVGRPGAVRDRVNELVGAMVEETIDSDQLREDFAKEQLAEVRESIRWNKEEGKTA